MFKQQKYEVIDRIHRQYAERYAAVDEYWLLVQTLFTTKGRRDYAETLKLEYGSKVLDLGAGFGAFAFDLAALYPAHIIAVDTDQTTLQTARQMQQEIEQAKGFHPSSQLQQINADVYALPFEEASFDVVIARFLFQHLTNPVEAMREIARVLKPGGKCIAVDIDDQYVITYPELSRAFTVLHAAFSKLQEVNGGDRLVGRKLPLHMRKAGFRDVQIDIRPQAVLSYVESNDISLQYSLLRFSRARNDMIHAGCISESEFDLQFAQLQTESEVWQFSANAEFYVSGIK